MQTQRQHTGDITTVGTSDSLPDSAFRRPSIEQLTTDPIFRVESISQACEVHKNPGARITFQTGVSPKEKADLELFASRFPLPPGSTSQRLFLKASGSINEYQSELNAALQTYTFPQEEARSSLVRFLENITSEFVEARAIAPDGFIADLGILNMGATPRWHLDSFDATRSKLQLIVVCSGIGGTLVTSGNEYDMNRFLETRNGLNDVHKRFEQTKNHILSEEGLDAWRVKKSSHNYSHQLISASYEKTLRELVPEDAGISTDPHTVLIFKAGEVLHANPAVEAKRLVYSILEK